MNFFWSYVGVFVFYVCGYMFREWELLKIVYGYYFLVFFFGKGLRMRVLLLMMVVWNVCF